MASNLKSWTAPHLANKYIKRTSTIELADTYTALPKPEERFSNDCFAWLKAPYVEPLRVREQLPTGDREHLLQMWEKTDKQIQDQRYEDQSDFKNKERQMGKIMHSGELVKRILKLNRDLIVEDSKGVKGCAGFYLMRNGVRAWTNASFKKGWVSEFSIIHTDAADLPVRVDYGWRTCLVRLLKFGAISWQQVLTTFGDVHYSDTRGRHWSKNVAGLRT
jgi:hypothetical protein